VPTRTRNRDVRGLLLLDKPGGVTSNGALQRVKHLFQAAKAGHTGSLDPLATGMLPICFGAATSVCAYLLDARKAYRVVAALGATTDTGDADGNVVATSDCAPPDRDTVAAALERFEGTIEQIPPMYSALKQDGVRLYELARRGLSVPRAARSVVIESLQLEHYRWPEVALTVRCSKGTYVRTLVQDVAAALGTLGYVRELRRLYVDPFAYEPMLDLATLEASAAEGGLAALDRRLLPLDRALPEWPAVPVSAASAECLAHGQGVAADPAWPVGRVRVYAPAGDLLALAEVSADRRLVPLRVFGR
jgi:tRNA pseudouridine55 synthase